MTTQSEQTLENNLIAQLRGMEYGRVQIADEAALLANLKAQLEKHNEVQLSDKEFEKILNHLNKGNVFDRAKTLRDKMHLIRDDGTSAYIEFINQKEWCQNQFQVTNQTTIEGSYKNRYDVTILINGLPLVQIELKRRGLELKEAFNQVNRYHRHSYNSGYGLYQYIQLFVISNGVNTKYYANNRDQSFKQTFYWADEENQTITKLEDFAKVFLQKCHLAKMIAKYIVVSETEKALMVLRPYQYFAVEAIIDRVKNSSKNGYIWHTTGSGKTLTSFKASQILVGIPEVHKVVFVVDRNDLDYKTIQDFNSYKTDSVDPTDDTKGLVKQLGGDAKLVVTTIQKLNNAITREHHQKETGKLKDKKVVFIFDECHRSQFGETHKRITEYFTNHQLLGFTGTPIFADNAGGNAFGKRTTKDLFGEQLHSYVITDAIRDENVLKFSVEYYKGFRLKNGVLDTDIDVEAIDIKEALESPMRLQAISDFIIANHDSKTHSRDFNAMFAVSSIDTLTKYYELLKAKKSAGEHNLKIATIFSFGTNEEDKDANGLLDSENELQLSLGSVNKHSRDALESYIGDYNAMYGTSFSTKDTQSFYNYYKDIARRVRKHATIAQTERIDILLVVNMFLTGFDSKTLNTLYVDKNLRYHGLIQAYSRTNRILNEQKSQGNIVVFRNLKKATDDAIKLFSDKNAKEDIFMHPYEVYLEQFKAAVDVLQKLAPTPMDVDLLYGEEQELAFIKSFRDLLRVKNILVSFVDFNFADTAIAEQVFNDYKSKYLDLHDKVRTDNEKEKVSILDDIDFELELIRRDEISVDYIVQLLAQLVEATDEQKSKIILNIKNTISTEAALRSKRDLIKKFIEQNIPKIHEADAVEGEFQNFMTAEKQQALERLIEDESLDTEKLEKLIADYIFTSRKPRREELISTLAVQPKVLERDSIIKRVGQKLNDFIETFIEGI